MHSRPDRARWLRAERVPEAVRAGIRLLGGHRLPRAAWRGFPGREIRECVLIRDPVSFNVSMYNFLVGRPREQSGIPEGTPFTAWYDGYRRNRITRFLLRNYFGVSEVGFTLMPPARRLAYLSERLAGFWFVGSHTDCGTLIGRIAGDLGIAHEFASRNTAKPGALRPGDLPSALVTRILEENALDAALFERWGRANEAARGAPASVL